MTKDVLDLAIEEAERFLKKAKHASGLMKVCERETKQRRERIGTGDLSIPPWPYEPHKEIAAAKRASMDLTRALAEVRKAS